MLSILKIEGANVFSKKFDPKRIFNHEKGQSSELNKFLSFDFFAKLRKVNEL